VAKTRRASDDDVRRRPDDEDDDAPRRARRREDDEDEAEEGPFKPRKRRKSAAGPVRLILRICGGVALATLIIILLIWIYSPVGTDHSLLCYLPPETTRISGYDVDEGFKNYRLKEVHDALINNYRAFGDRRFSNSGVSDKDVAKYLSGVASPKDPDEERDLPPQDRRGSITVIRFKQAVDQAKFLGSFTGQYRVEERNSKDGKKYHHLYRLVRVPPDLHEEREDDISFFFPNSRTLVYTTTWRECEEALTRQPGRVAVQGDMRELSDKVDGHYFQASTGWWESNGISNTMAFGLGFVDSDVRDQKGFVGRTGTASWFADNGNDFLYASASLYENVQTARSVRRKLSVSFDKALGDIWRSEAGKPAGLEDPFNPKQPAQQGGIPGAGGFAGGGGGGSNEQTKDIIEALAEYAATARVYNRGRLVIIEGRIPHGNPEQGIFEKFWKAVGTRFQGQNQGGFGGPGMPGMPGMPMGPGGPGGPGMPGGPPMPGPRP
jgi:hypothetical protein